MSDRLTLPAFCPDCMKAIKQCECAIREIKPVATMSVCCQMIRIGVHPDGVMHDGLCRGKHGENLGPTYYLYTADALAAARDAALEEAAKVCDELIAMLMEVAKDNNSWDDKYSDQADGAEKCADAIRALKEKK